MYKHVYIYTLLCSQEYGYPMVRRELRSCACLHIPNHFFIQGVKLLTLKAKCILPVELSFLLIDAWLCLGAQLKTVSFP